MEAVITILWDNEVAFITVQGKKAQFMGRILIFEWIQEFKVFNLRKLMRKVLLKIELIVVLSQVPVPSHN